MPFKINPPKKTALTREKKKNTQKAHKPPPKAQKHPQTKSAKTPPDAKKTPNFFFALTREKKLPSSKNELFWLVRPDDQPCDQQRRE